MLRFGAYASTVGPGYNWHMPWPIERKIIVNVSQEYSVPDEAQMLTADTNLVEIRSAVQYTQPEASQVPLQRQRRRRHPEAGERECIARGSGTGIARSGARLRSEHRRSCPGYASAHARELRHGRADHQRHAAGSAGAGRGAGRTAGFDQGPVKTATATSRTPRPTTTMSCRGLAVRRPSSCSRPRRTSCRCSRLRRVRPRGSIRSRRNTSTHPR